MDVIIGVVIVLYYSRESNFEALLDLPNISVILVDNTPGRKLQINNNKINYIPLFENMGIAYAQNIGIEKAKELDCSYIVFFDQDSIINAEYINNIYTEYLRLKNYYPKLAVLGPTVIDKDSGNKYKTNPLLKEYECEVVPAIISSGSIFKTDIFDLIGTMEEELFIDNVDDEWGWRATYYGYVCCMTYRIKLLHKIGQKSFKFLGIPFIVSSPVRYYYQYRNYLWLLRRNYVPSEWKCKSFIRKLVEIIIIPCVSKNRLIVIRSIFKGIYDGLFKCLKVTNLNH